MTIFPKILEKVCRFYLASALTLFVKQGAGDVINVLIYFDGSSGAFLPVQGHTFNCEEFHRGLECLIGF